MSALSARLFHRSGGHCLAAVVAVLALAGWGVVRGVDSITIPNASFETQANSYVNINIDSWQKAPKPAWYVESGGYMWTQLVGAFKNTASTSRDHIDNCDGAQAIWVFAVPEVALFQDYDSVDYNDPAPTHAFAATFDIGKSYDLTVGVLGGGGGMYEGVTLELSLYYRDGGGNKVTLATTSVVNTVDTFPTNTHFTDFRVHLPVVKPGDAWAGKHIGVQFLSTVSQDLQGGYWDLDNVRLTSTVEPPFPVSPTRSGSNLRLGWPSAVGYTYQVSSSPDLISWTDFGTLQTGTGSELSILVPQTGGTKPYYRVKVTSAP